MRQIYSKGDAWRAQFGPVAAPRAETLFAPQAYEGGALVLYALRERIGQPAFERLQREWLRRYEGRSAGTANFTALASAVAHEDLAPFLREWLYGTTTPPMPGHPEWEQETPGTDLHARHNDMSSASFGTPDDIPAS
jgi:aminopeptidase N